MSERANRLLPHSHSPHITYFVLEDKGEVLHLTDTPGRNVGAVVKFHTCRVGSSGRNGINVDSIFIGIAVLSVKDASYSTVKLTVLSLFQAVRVELSMAKITADRNF
jgi:hypothetical protein